MLKTSSYRCIFLLVAALQFVSVQATQPEPWDFWIVADQANAESISHESWQQILNLYLVSGMPDGINRFKYSAVTDSDRARLRDYLDRLAATDPRKFRRVEQRAYWINLYNALTVEVVLEHYPVASIRRINGGLFNTGPWDEVVIDIAGQPLTLNDIEHRILRPIWRDPRVHFAVNCASLGCPNLAAQAFTAANTDNLLEQGARDYINNSRGVDMGKGRLTLSSIFDWYADDFGSSRKALLEELAGYAEPELADKLRGYSGLITYAYDWRLNDID